MRIETVNIHDWQIPFGRRRVALFPPTAVDQCNGRSFTSTLLRTPNQSWQLVVLCYLER